MDLRGHLDLLLLATLQRLGEAHGYALIAELRSISDGAFDLAEGTVYPALHRLERGGAVTSSADRTAGRPRRVYRLTGAGQAMLTDRRSQWHAFADGMRKIIGPAEASPDRRVPAGPTLGACAPSPLPPSRSLRWPARSPRTW
jgi:DNA-binding PadR family transcriptional regulator